MTRRVSQEHVNKLDLTDKELLSLRMCISGELENDDRHQDRGHMNALRRVARKLDAARVTNRGTTDEAVSP